MVMPFLTRLLLESQLVTAWPNIKCSWRQSDDALQAPCVFFISVRRSCFGGSSLRRSEPPLLHDDQPQPSGVLGVRKVKRLQFRVVAGESKDLRARAHSCVSESASAER